MSNLSPWVKNLGGADGPLIKLVKFSAGSSQAIARGEILKLSSGAFVPLDADESMAAVIAVAAKDVVAGDLAGYMEVYVPRDDDVFEFPLAAAAAAALGASLYWSSSTVLTTTAGSNVIGKVWDHEGIPGRQGRLTKGHLMDKGTTIGSVSSVHMIFNEAVSYLAAFQTGDA